MLLSNGPRLPDCSEDDTKRANKGTASVEFNYHLISERASLNQYALKRMQIATHLIARTAPRF
jgi:hypothetical protein